MVHGRRLAERARRLLVTDWPPLRSHKETWEQVQWIAEGSKLQEKAAKEMEEG